MPSQPVQLYQGDCWEGAKDDINILANNKQEYGIYYDCPLFWCNSNKKVNKKK